MYFPFKKFFKNVLGRELLGGPFKGMAYSGEAIHSTLLPKILGCYECEIAPDIVALIANSHQTIAIVGCAEGYYAVGSLLLNPEVRVVAFDPDASAQKACQAIALRNGVEQRLQVKGYCDVATLNELMAQEHVDFLLVDVEGYERELLDPQRVACLQASSILVEVHGGAAGGMNELLVDRFTASHTIKRVDARKASWQDIENPYFRTLARISPTLENSFVYERPDGMSWLIMEPKAAQ